MSSFVANAEVFVKWADLIDLILSQGKIVDLNVLQLVLKRSTARNGNSSSGYGPIEHHLCPSLSFGFADLLQTLVAPNLFSPVVPWATDRNVTYWDDRLDQHKFDEVFLRVGWVQLNFIHHGFYATVTKQVSQHLQTEVADTNWLCEALVDQRLKFGPKNVHWHSILWVILEKSSWPVDHVAVNIVDLKFLKWLSQCRLWLFKSVHPQLSHNEEWIAHYFSRCEDAIDRLAYQGLICVNWCAV